MTSEMYSTADELRRIIADGRISEEALQAITGIQPEKLQSSLNEAGAKPGMMAFTTEPQALSNDEIARLSILAAQLTEGLRIGDDERLKAIFESLTIWEHRPTDGTRRRRPAERPARPADPSAREEVRTRGQGFVPHRRRQSSTRSVMRTGTAKSSEMLCGAGTSTFRFRAGRMGTFRAPSLLTSRYPIEEGLSH